LILLSGCTVYDLGPLVLDWRIDRNRVVAMRFDPPAVAYDEPFTVEALALAPRGTEIVRVHAQTCVASEVSVHTAYSDLGCFQEEELAAELGPLPATASFPSPAADDSGYFGGSTFPVLVEAIGEAGDPGYGYVFVTPLDAPARSERTLADVTQELTWTGEVRPGGELALSWRIRSRRITRDDPGIAWYVDDGELLDTGRTAAWDTGDGWTASSNRLVIPDDWSGPLRIVVVAATNRNRFAGADVGWIVKTVDVP
jgi:hypothetical protein